MLYDYEGNEYVDFLVSVGFVNVGYGNKEIL